MTAEVFSSNVHRRPVGEGLFTGSLGSLDELQLMGMRCRTCSITSFGRSDLCPHCGEGDLSEIALSREGTLTTFSILRHSPPGDYRGPKPFEPFAVGLIALREGVAVVSPLLAPIDDIRIGMPMRLVPHILYRADDGAEVIAFRFAPVEQKAAR